MEHTDWITQTLQESRKKATFLKRVAFLWQDVRVGFYRFFNLDYSKVVGYPMTCRGYKKWQKRCQETAEIRYFKCDGYEVCSCLDGLSPHLPIGEGWMACHRDSGLGFKCGVATRACL